MDVKGKKVLVLGLGETGMSMTRWLARHGAVVSVADTRDDPPHAGALQREMPGVALERGAFREASLAAADMIAISPGIDRRTPAVAAAIRRGVPVVGDVELFAQALAQRAASDSSRHAPRILGITGTNGKSTVTRMAGDICLAAGLDTVVAGNIGTPVLDALTDIENGRAVPAVFVLELSSFQLESTESLDTRRRDAAQRVGRSSRSLRRHRRLRGGQGAHIQRQWRAGV